MVNIAYEFFGLLWRRGNHETSSLNSRSSSIWTLSWTTTNQDGVELQPVNSKNTWNDNLAAIFEAKLKAAIDNRGVKK